MRWHWLLAAGVAGLLGSTAVADIPAPPRPQNPSTPAQFVVEIDGNAREARLIVPRKIAGKNAGLDARERPFQGTVLAGVSLALALSCAGLWVVRRGRRGGKGIALLLVGISLAAGSAVVWANAPPPDRRPRPRPQQPEQIYGGKIAVEYVAEGDTVRLILPPDLARNWGKPVGGATGAAPAPGGARPIAPARPE